MNQFANVDNNMNNLDMIQQGDNNMMNQEPRMEVELRDDRKEENEVEEDKESNRSNPLLLKEKIIYNENDINAQTNNQNEANFIDPNLIPNAGGGYMAEA